MAENDENPRKKQKLDEFPVQSNTLQADIHPLKERVDKKEDKNSPDSINIESELDQPGVSQTLEVVEGPISSQNDESSWETDSEASAMSPFSGEDMWKGDTEPLSWVYHMMSYGENPRTVLQEIMPNGVPDLDDFSLWRLLLTIVSEPPPREKLLTVNTISDVIHLIQRCQNIIVLTGAGVSVSCGIPDFRSRNGIYARLAVDFPDLPDPQAMFDIRYFRNDQRPFFKFAKEIYPGQFEPSKCHRFIRLMEEHGKLLRNYTQNIDTLEQVAGIQNVIQCHGSFATATCMACKYKCSSDDIKQDIMDQVIPKCSKCDPPTDLSIMKPDIVFFGESLPEEFHRQMAADKEKCDLLIVIGSSLKVRPVALIPNSLPAHVPQILINKEYLRALNFDVELLGDCEIIISELCRQLGDKWESLANKDNPLTEIRTGDLVTPPETPIDVGGDNIDSKSVDISLKSQGLENTIDSKTKTTQKTSKNVHDNVESSEHVAGNIEVILTQNDSKVTSSNVEQFESDGISEKDHELDQEPSSCKTDQNGSEAPIWVPSKWRVSERLGPGQYCFMPPNRYIFKDAEVFIADSDSSDETDDSDSHNDEDDKTEMETAEERHVVNESQENSVALATQTEENIKQDEVAGNKNDSRCEVLKLDAFSNTVGEFQEQKKEEITTQNSKLHVEELSN